MPYYLATPGAVTTILNSKPYRDGVVLITRKKVAKTEATNLKPLD